MKHDVFARFFKLKFARPAPTSKTCIVFCLKFLSQRLTVGHPSPGDVGLVEPGASPDRARIVLFPEDRVLGPILG